MLERRGRFLTAEPLFGVADHGPSRARSSARMVVRSTASAEGRHARPGDVVLLEIATRGPIPERSGAHVVRVIGRPDVARDMIEALMLDRGLRREFDPAVEQEAKAVAAAVARREQNRRDLRELPTFTIDPASARDFDDAISAEALAEGSARVWVHIADVAAHVREGSLLDREARRRATSVYVPGAVEPMLPHALSSDACSLMPGAERAAVTVELELRDAQVVRAAFYRSLIRSDERLDYERVDRVFAGSEPAREPWAEPLRVAREVAAWLQEKRERSGALVIDSEEPEFEFDEHGDVREMRAQSQTESHRLIEHLMIAANEAVAGLLEQRGVPCLFRVHEPPDPDRIERLVDQLSSLEVPTPPVPEQMSSTQAAELLGEISKRVDQHVRRSARGRMALSSLVLRSLKQAYYSPRNVGHAGLRSPSYCHFTSPIRRYPDLVCHRALLSAVAGEERAPRAGEMVELGVWASERERDAMKLERDGDDMARCFLLARLLADEGPHARFAGEITGLISAGAFIAFDARRPLARADRAHGSAGHADPTEPVRASEMLFEGMLPVRLLRSPARTDGGGREWWELNEEGTILYGERTGATLRLGDATSVSVARVDTVRGRVDLVPAG
jgi:ribonuclease R